MRVVPDRRTRRRVAYGVGGIDRVNRLVLTVLGVAAAAAAILAILLDTGAITWSETPGSIYRQSSGDAIASPEVSAAIAAGGCLILAIVALVWALAQLRPVGGDPKLGTIQLGTSERGRTTIPATAIAKAAASDISNLFGVLDAEVRLFATRPRPRVQVTLELGLDAAVDGVMTEVSAALDRLAAALEADGVDAELRLRFGSELRKARGTNRVR